ncbi:MAG: hypothetical protein NT153_00965 [Bacteroidetes bacterium]|nr:hypothetical protein [Bacteroidota bacterium]
MKANIEKVLTEIGSSNESLAELVVMFGINREYENKTDEELRDELRNSITEVKKDDFIKMCMGIGAIEYDESKITIY